MYIVVHKVSSSVKRDDTLYTKPTESNPRDTYFCLNNRELTIAEIEIYTCSGALPYIGWSSIAGYRTAYNMIVY